jgi:hypothetical protein
MQAFYAKLAENPEAQAKLVADFQTMYGPMTEALNREAASQAGTTEAQAEQVLATTYPAVAQALGKDNADKTEEGFEHRLKNLFG